MKKLVLLVALVTMSSAVLPSEATPSTSRFSCPMPACIKSMPSSLDAVIRNNPYYAMVFAAVAAVVATKAVDAYIANQEESDEEYFA
ncbi:MAG: hypothetical protein NTZ68_03190 [Candidatus Dependentiae bacterium]|nr:hypothetical protein [Candidatus Dependentiae bacterium]